MSILFYQKPEFVKKEIDLSHSSCQKYVERAAGSRANIPPELSFDNVVEGRSLPPCTLQDFLDYLVYVSHDAENLQFFLWLKDYTARFDALPSDVKVLSQPWYDAPMPYLSRPYTNSTTASTIPPYSPYTPRTPRMPQTPRTPLTPSIMKPLPRTPVAPISAIPPSPAVDLTRWGPADTDPLVLKEFSRVSTDTSFRPHSSTSSQRPPSFSLRPLSVFTSTPPPPSPAALAAQPFRQEIDRIAAHYIVSGAPRELNLSGRERKLALEAIANTTHPSALSPIGSLCEQALRHHSHRNFVRWSICNGNKPRVFVLRSLAVTVLSTVIALCVFLILSGYSRWYRLALTPALYFGCVNLIAARQGLCVLLHRRHTRERRPWEIDEKGVGGVGVGGGDGGGQGREARQENGTRARNDQEVREAASRSENTNHTPSNSSSDRTRRPDADVLPWETQDYPADGGEDGLHTSNSNPSLSSVSASQNPRRPLLRRLSPFGPRNSYEHEPWLGAWRKRNAWQKIRIQKVRIASNGGLRIIQDRIVWQAEAWGLLVTVVIMCVVVAFPSFGIIG